MLIRKLLTWIMPTNKYFKSSADYWKKRYVKGGNSGTGSYGRMAEFKAEVLNEFVERNNIKSIVEFGCGDGNQLKYMSYPFYTGYDISKTAIRKCKNAFRDDSSKEFKLMDHYHQEQADLTLALEVIFHLIEDDVYHDYMEKLFLSSKMFVIIFSSNSEVNEIDQADHVKHRKFTSWIGENNTSFEVIEKINNRYPYNGLKDTSFSDFFIFRKKIMVNNG